MTKQIYYLIGILLTAISLVLNEYVIKYLKIIILFMDDKFLAYPFVAGVFFSWLFAFLSILIILKLANIKNKNEFRNIFIKYERKLLILTMLILFYMAIHLASTAFGNITIPFFSESYDRSDFFGYFSPQDVFISLLAFSVVLLVFYIGPKIPILQKLNIPIPLPKLATEKKYNWLCFSCDNKPINLLTIIFLIFLILSVIISFKIIPILPSLPEMQFEQAKPDESMFVWIFIISFVILIFFTYHFKDIFEDINAIKDDFKGLFIFYCIVPAIIVASLVLSGNDLVKYPNFAGHIVVGVIFISGFYTFITLIRIYISTKEKPYLIMFYLALISFAAIFLFTLLFLLVCSDDIQEKFRHTLNFIVVMIIMILIYSVFYEKLEKYTFTEWWKEWKTISIIFSMIVILIVSTIGTECNIFGYTIPKVIIIFLALILLICLPWIIGLIIFRGKKWPQYQGTVLVKAETSPEKLKKLKNKLSSEDGLYNTKVIMGEYDLCLNIEGLDLDDIAKKVLEIREIEGIISTTTFIDINEFFDQEVK